MLRGFKLALLSCLIVGPVFFKVNAEEVKIGFVNMDRVIREAPVAIKASRKMEQKFEGRRQELQSMADDIKSRKAALSEKGSSLSDSQRRIQETELTEISVKFQRKQQAFQEDISIWQNEETSALLDKANRAITQIAESEHFDMILHEAVVVSNRLDITDKVIKKLTGD